eukprot:1089338-Karenia_brevis.AAC.1
MGTGDSDPVPLTPGLAIGLALSTPEDLDCTPTGAAAGADDDDEAAFPESLKLSMKAADPGGTG